MCFPAPDGIGLTTSLRRLISWIDSAQPRTPIRHGANIPYLYQFDLSTLREVLIHVLAAHGILEREYNNLFAIRQRLYSQPIYRHRNAFRFVDELALTGTPGLVADEKLWMGDQCESKNAVNEIRAFHSALREPGPDALAEAKLLTGEMLRHSIEVLVRMKGEERGVEVGGWECAR